MTLGNEEDYCWDEELPQVEEYRHEFSDGSVIIIPDMEDPQIEIPHKRFKKEWICEDAKNYILEYTLDYYESITYVKNLEKSNLHFPATLDLKNWQ